MQTVQRAEFWGAIVALQAYWPCVSQALIILMLLRLLDDCWIRTAWLSLCPLVKDGDSVALVQYMIGTRGRETVRVTKVKGHAEDSDVQHGRVRLGDQLGNDAAAGRRHQSEDVIDAGRRLLKVRSH